MARCPVCKNKVAYCVCDKGGGGGDGGGDYNHGIFFLKNKTAKQPK